MKEDGNQPLNENSNFANRTVRQLLTKYFDRSAGCRCRVRESFEKLEGALFFVIFFTPLLKR